MTSKGVGQRPCERVDGATRRVHEDAVAIEEPLEIRIHGDPVAVTMRTPGEDRFLALGFLFAEGLIASRDDVSSVAPCGRPGEEGYGNVIEVTPAPGVRIELERVQASRRGTLTTSACGVCGRRTVDDLMRACGTVGPPDAGQGERASGAAGVQVPASLVASAPSTLRAAQANFARTGGVHAAAALTSDGRVLAVFEDVGRHNAVDKVVGALLLENCVGRPLLSGPLDPWRRPTLLAVSGRASFEIVQKAAMAKIPIVASVSAASSLAIDLAQRAGVTLVAFVREGRATIYTHPERILAQG